MKQRVQSYWEKNESYLYSFSINILIWVLFSSQKSHLSMRTRLLSEMLKELTTRSRLRGQQSPPSTDFSRWACRKHEAGGNINILFSEYYSPLTPDTKSIIFFDYWEYWEYWHRIWDKRERSANWVWQICSLNHSSGFPDTDCSSR